VVEEELEKDPTEVWESTVPNCFRMMMFSFHKPKFEEQVDEQLVALLL